MGYLYSISEHLIWLQAAVTLILCLITFDQNLLAVLTNTIEAVSPIKILLGIVASCFLLIGFVISFHTNVFTSHDHYNVPKESNGSKRNGYNWFNLSHVYRFPIEQLVPEVATIQINNFDVVKDQNPVKDNYLFIIDKTGTTQESDSIIEVSRLAKNRFYYLFLISTVHTGNKSMN